MVFVRVEFEICKCSKKSNHALGLNIIKYGFELAKYPEFFARYTVAGNFENFKKFRKKSILHRN